MATPISASGLGGLPYCFYGSSAAPFNGDDGVVLRKAIRLQAQRSKLSRPCPVMKNVNEGKGIFAPVVVLARNVIGNKRFNQLRGKAIALHSQVINEFCKTIGADGKQRQGLIRLAKKNGEKLGFLA